MPAHTKYKAEYAEQLPEMFANGEDVAEVACRLKVSRVTFYEWVKTYPDFKDGYDLGKQNSEAWWSKLGRAGAAGKVSIQPTVWIFNMKNKFGWTDKTEIDHSSKDQSMSPTRIELVAPKSDN